MDVLIQGDGWVFVLINSPFMLILYFYFNPLNVDNQESPIS